MGGKVEKICLKYFDAAKMRSKVGTLISDKMNRFHVLHCVTLRFDVFHVCVIFLFISKLFLMSGIFLMLCFVVSTQDDEEAKRDN